jgi:hypothetical protein
MQKFIVEANFLLVKVVNVIAGYALEGKLLKEQNFFMRQMLKVF